MAARNRFTIYDALEQSGHFDKNPANAQARDADGLSLYAGPVTYPMMFYHPEGQTRITVASVVEVTPFGPERRGEQREIVWQLARDAAEASRLRTAGWHDHPAKAIEARGDEAPSMGQGEEIKLLQAEIARLQQQASPAPAAARK